MLKRRKLALCLASIVVALLLGEGILLLAGFEPGYLDAGYKYGPAFDPDVKLEVWRLYGTDDEGVFKANPASFPEGTCPEGFRSPPIRYEETTKPKVLFLGDSFTWGHSAVPIDQCFVDLVRRQGYVCYNTGIPTADPNQYAFLAEKYVPEVRPDFVAVMICMGNDLNSWLRNPMRPGEDVFHQTNMGWFYAFDLDGRHMTPEEAYRFAHDLAYQRFKDSGAFWKTLLLTSRVGTVVGVGLANLLGAEGPGAGQVVDRGYVRDALGRIRAVCDRYQARMLVFLIPHHPGLEDASTSVTAQRHVFDGYRTFTPSSITARHYRELPDDHLNNAGHQLFAELILRATREPRGTK